MEISTKFEATILANSLERVLNEWKVTAPKHRDEVSLRINKYASEYKKLTGHYYKGRHHKSRQ